MLTHKFSKAVISSMLQRGADKQALGTLKSNMFDVEEAVHPFKPNLDGVKSKTFSQQRQLSMLERLLERPFYGNPVVVINSYPSDLRARIVAINIMAAAVREQLSNRGVRPGRSLPLWHPLFGGYSDTLRDKSLDERPSMLILSNVNCESTPQKLEKLRDILEMYGDTTRIVVTGGQDPITFFGKRLFYPLSGAIHISPDNRVNILMDM